MHKPAAIELNFIAHRIAEALRHYPDDGDTQTQTRWEHGLAREMVQTMSNAPPNPYAHADSTVGSASGLP